MSSYLHSFYGPCFGYSDDAGSAVELWPIIQFLQVHVSGRLDKSALDTRVWRFYLIGPINWAQSLPDVHMNKCISRAAVYKDSWGPTWKYSTSSLLTFSATKLFGHFLVYTDQMNHAYHTAGMKWNWNCIFTVPWLARKKKKKIPVVTLSSTNLPCLCGRESGSLLCNTTDCSNNNCSQMCCQPAGTCTPDILMCFNCRI